MEDDKFARWWVSVMARPPALGESELFAQTRALFEENMRLKDLTDQADELISKSDWGSQAWINEATKWILAKRKLDQ